MWNTNFHFIRFCWFFCVCLFLLFFRGLHSHRVRECLPIQVGFFFASFGLLSLQFKSGQCLQLLCCCEQRMVLLFSSSFNVSIDKILFQATKKKHTNRIKTIFFLSKFALNVLTKTQHFPSKRKKKIYLPFERQKQINDKNVCIYIYSLISHIIFVWIWSKHKFLIFANATPQTPSNEWRIEHMVKSKWRKRKHSLSQTRLNVPRRKLIMFSHLHLGDIIQFQFKTKQNKTSKLKGKNVPNEWEKNSQHR